MRDACAEAPVDLAGMSGVCPGVGAEGGEAGVEGQGQAIHQEQASWRLHHEQACGRSGRWVCVARPAGQAPMTVDVPLTSRLTRAVAPSAFLSSFLDLEQRKQWEPSHKAGVVVETIPIHSLGHDGRVSGGGAQGAAEDIGEGRKSFAHVVLALWAWPLAPMPSAC
jgi:hypothetical protein